MKNVAGKNMMKEGVQCCCCQMCYCQREKLNKLVSSSDVSIL